MWQPAPEDVEWTKNLLRMLNDHGFWGTTNGAYCIDKTKKTLVLKMKAPTFDQGMHDQIAICCKKLGYEVLIADKPV